MRAALPLLFIKMLFSIQRSEALSWVAEVIEDFFYIEVHQSVVAGKIKSFIALSRWKHELEFYSCLFICIFAAFNDLFIVKIFLLNLLTRKFGIISKLFSSLQLDTFENVNSMTNYIRWMTLMTKLQTKSVENFMNFKVNREITANLKKKNCKHVF